MDSIEQNMVVGRLEVHAICDTSMGGSKRIVPTGEIGYVMGQLGTDYLIFWPNVQREYAGDWRLGCHPISAVKPTENAPEVNQ